MSVWAETCVLFCLLALLFKKSKSRLGLDWWLMACFWTGAFDWLGFRADVTACWNCCKEKQAAVLSETLGNNFILWCKIYCCQKTLADMHIKSTVSFFSRTSTLNGWSALTPTYNLRCARYCYRRSVIKS